MKIIIQLPTQELKEFESFENYIKTLPIGSDFFTGEAKEHLKGYLCATVVTGHFLKITVNRRLWGLVNARRFWDIYYNKDHEQKAIKRIRDLKGLPMPSYEKVRSTSLPV